MQAPAGTQIASVALRRAFSATGGSDVVWEVYDDGRGPSLFVSGSFTRAGAGQVCLLAQWVGCTDQCYPDCINDGRLNIRDFSCFLDAFAAGSP